MEGVLVRAQRASSTMRVTVVSDDKGHFHFPRSHMPPGVYTLSVRAVGWDLEGPQSIEVKDGAVAAADIKLVKTRDLAAELSNGEWAMSMPGDAKQKRMLLACVSCHTLERAARSRYSAKQFSGEIFPRMNTYTSQSTPDHRQYPPAKRDGLLTGEARQEQWDRNGKWLATVNLSDNRSTWTYELKTNPRPKGRQTHVIYTEYFLPGRSIMPHDVITDKKGMAWFPDAGNQQFGRLNPKTGEVKLWPMTTLRPDVATGVFSIRADEDGNLWMGMQYNSGIAMFDPKTEKLKVFAIPKEIVTDKSQINMVAPMHSKVDGKVWAHDKALLIMYRFDIKTETWETFDIWDKNDGKTHDLYDVISDSQNNVYFTDMDHEHIGRIDAKTKAVTFYETPTKSSRPRRGSMDAKDRLWFGEYGGDRIAMLDTKTGAMKEWEMPTPWSAPYDVCLDKNDNAWTASMFNDMVSRLDVKSGKITEYLLPAFTNVRRVFVDDHTTPPTFWVGDDHGASITRLEPLD